jgi:hypothetical protein
MISLSRVRISAVVCFMFLCSVKTTHGQEVIPFQVSPARQELTADPGETVPFTIKYFNFGSDPLTGLLQTADFIVVGNSGNPKLVDDPRLASPRFSASTWVTLPYDRMSISAQDKVVIQGKIHVPTNARPGGRYVAVYYQPQPGNQLGSTTPQQTRTEIQTRLVSLIYLRINGDISEAASVDRLFSQSFIEYGPLSITASISNSGDYHISPKGFITIKDMFGNTRYEKELPEQNIFPDSAHKYELNMGEKWMIGRYKITLSGGYGEQGKGLRRETYVWVIPWKVTLIVLLGLIIVILLLKLFIAKGQKRQELLEDKLTHEEEEIAALKAELQKK